jgi:hypothetical protein
LYRALSISVSILVSVSLLFINLAASKYVLLDMCITNSINPVTW